MTFDWKDAVIVNAPDVRDWKETTTITKVIFDQGTTRVEFDKQDGPNRWPDVTPVGWTGPLQYTLWLFRQIEGKWYGSAFIQFWYGRQASGSASDPDVPSVYHQHWFYGSRWSPLLGSTPFDVDRGKIRPREQIAFMVTSGNERDSGGPYSVGERSNVVVFPAMDQGTFTFPTPDPTPVPPTTPPSSIEEKLDALIEKVDLLQFAYAHDSDSVIVVAKSILSALKDIRTRQDRELSGSYGIRLKPQG